MQDFDADRERRAAEGREFRIGGETFRCRNGLAPEQLLPWYEMRTGEATVYDEELQTERRLNQREALAVYDQTVLLFLEPGQEGRWRAVREQAENPLTFEDLVDLIHWLIEGETGRPTRLPAASSGGSGNGATGTRSTEESSSPAVAV